MRSLPFSDFREVPDTTNGLGNETVHYSVDNLRPMTRYNFSILARNKDGYSETSRDQVDVYTLGELNSVQRNPVIYSMILKKVLC